MEATAACSSASIARTLASSPLPHHCRSRVRVPERRWRGRAVVAAAASTGNYVVPLDAASSGITRPLVEILRNLNKRVPETIVLPASRRASASDPVIPWYHANWMLSFYAPGWCGEVRDVIYNDNGMVTVVYRVTIRGIDGENDTMMNSTQDPAVRDASGNAHTSEERDDAHDSFLQVKKGYVLVTRMESITTYKNQHGQQRSGTQDQSNTQVSANDMCALEEWPSHARRNRAQLQDGMNYRSFKDDVVVIMKRKLPLIGDRWDLEDTPDTEEKVLTIAKEPYIGWRSTLSSTYKAYKTDAARLANLPEDLQPEEWEWMIEYFGSDLKFQERSQKNTDKCKKHKTKHRIGSKSYSQVSFEKDKACEEVKNKENETQGPLSDEQRHNIFQTTYKGTLHCKSSQPRGYGYMAKPSTGSERIRIQIEEKARATAAFQQRNSELSHQITDLQDQLQAERATTQEIINLERAEREQLEEKLKEERAERERLLEAERTSRLKFEKNMMAKFAEFSKQMGTQQVFTNRNDKENSNPNFQNTLLQRPSPNKAAGFK
ncbi:hypothetical protein D1007_39069 [Hordeum vulgare]|nr:hypothetical protein D1007_39069 [Hordeum vulgare]